MKLIKCIVHHSSYTQQFYCKMGEVVEEKSGVLLGFKDSLPVITNSKPNSEKRNEICCKKILKVQVDPNTGEKFINLNGKKLKMVPEAQIKGADIKNQKSICLKSARGVKVFTKIPISAESVHKFQHSKIESQSSVKKMPSGITPVPYPSTIFKKINFSSLRTLNNDKDKHVIENNLKEITGDKGDLFNQTDNVAINRLKCTPTQRICAIDSVDMKPLKNEKEVQTLETRISQGFQVKECFTNVAVQTDLLIENNSIEKTTDFFPESTFSDFSLENLFFDDTLFPILNSDSFLHPVYSNQVASDKIATKFFGELRKAHLPDYEGNMPIHVSVLTNNMKMVQRSCFILNILEQSVDLRNNNGLSPLQLAVIYDVDIRIVDLLLCRNASLEIMDLQGNNVIHLAVQYNRINILGKLLEHVPQKMTYNILDQYNHEGMTPLIICSINGYYKCAELLLNLDANVNMRDQISGRTALFHAAVKQDLEMVQILLTYNAETKIKNFFGTSAHDAMYEIDDIKPKIKNLILGRSLKRRNTEDTRGMAKFKRPEDSNRIGLKTYSRLEKIEDLALIKNIKKEKNHEKL